MSTDRPVLYRTVARRIIQSARRGLPPPTNAELDALICGEPQAKQELRQRPPLRLVWSR